MSSEKCICSQHGRGGSAGCDRRLSLLRVISADTEGHGATVPCHPPGHQLAPGRAEGTMVALYRVTRAPTESKRHPRSGSCVQSPESGAGSGLVTELSACWPKQNQSPLRLSQREKDVNMKRKQKYFCCHQQLDSMTLEVFSKRNDSTISPNPSFCVQAYLLAHTSALLKGK